MHETLRIFALTEKDARAEASAVGHVLSLTEHPLVTCLRRGRLHFLYVATVYVV